MKRHLAAELRLRLDELVVRIVRPPNSAFYRLKVLYFPRPLYSDVLNL